MAVWLVTGGAGFIGSNIVHRLASEGETVRVFDDFSTGKRGNLEGLPARRVRIIEGDLRDAAAVARAAKGCSYVLHQGAVPSVPRSIRDPRTTHEVNVNGTVNVLEAARRHRTVKRVVMASSSSVYGDSPSLPKIETMPSSPLSPYAASKASAEAYARAYTSSMGVEVAVLRYFNVFGPRQDPKGAYAAVVPRFFQAALRDESPVIYGTGEQTRDFTYVTNVVEANLRAARTEGASGEVMNVACGERITIVGLANLIAEVVGSKARPRHEEGRAGEVRHSLADIGRMERVLGYVPAIDLRRGLARTVHWFRDGTIQ